MATVLTLTLVAAMTTTTAVYAVEINFVGQVTSEAAQEGGSEFGGHASDPTGGSPSNVGCDEDPGRCGLSQAITQEHGNPQHPSEVIGAICEATEGTAPGYP